MTECEACEVGDFYDVMESRLMYMTMLAHKQALFERIKKKIDAQEGEKLDKIAALLVEASDARAKKSVDEEKESRELREKLRGIVED